MKKRCFTTIAAVILAIAVGLLAIGCDHEPPPETPPETPPPQWGELDEGEQFPQYSDEEAGVANPWNE